MTLTMEQVRELFEQMQIRERNYVTLVTADGQWHSVRRELWEREPQPARLSGDAQG